MKTYLFLFLLLCTNLTVWAQTDYDTQRGVELFNQKDYALAVTYLQKASKAGSLQALDYLGYMYEYGLGVTKNASVAVNLYKKGVAQNYAPCMIAMGRLYENGTGVAKNPQQAYLCYKKAADMGYGGGELQVSLCKKAGYGTEQNSKEAFGYALKAANNGWGYEYLADMYYDGYGTDQNKEMAYVWYTKPESNYSDKAQLRVAVILSQGVGTVHQDLTEALDIVKKLKNKGSMEEGVNEWHDKIQLAAAEQERLDRIVVVPTFTDEIRRYIRNYPEPAKPAIESAGRGEIVISCRVEASGEISNARIKYRVLQRLDNAALALVNGLPKFTLGTKGGKPAAFDIEIGISFFPTKVGITKYVSVIRAN